LRYDAIWMYWTNAPRKPFRALLSYLHPLDPRPWPQPLPAQHVRVLRRKMLQPMARVERMQVAQQGSEWFSGCICSIYSYRIISQQISTMVGQCRIQNAMEHGWKWLESLRSNKAALPLHRSSSNINKYPKIIGYRFEDVWRCSESNQCLNLLSSQPLLWPCHVEGSRGRPSCTRWACMMLRPSDLLIPCQCWTMLCTN
jgi:hypothetical protein